MKTVLLDWWRSNIPAKFQAARLSSLDNAAALKLRQWIADDGDWGLTLHGGTGSGKTWAAYAAVAAWYQRMLTDGASEWIQPVLASVPHLVVTLQREAVESTATHYEELRKAPGIVLLDDLGAEKTTEFVVQQLYSILNEREANLRKTIITTNLTMTQIADRFSDRIASRLSSGRVLAWSGADRRTHKESNR